MGSCRRCNVGLGLVYFRWQVARSGVFQMASCRCCNVGLGLLYFRWQVVVVVTGPGLVRGAGGRGGERRGGERRRGGGGGGCGRPLPLREAPSGGGERVCLRPPSGRERSGEAAVERRPGAGVGAGRHAGAAQPPVSEPLLSRNTSRYYLSLEPEPVVTQAPLNLQFSL
eukprot:782961-Prorocentrum_minimum.AAC.1